MRMFKGHLIDDWRAERILKALRENPEGLSISEVSRLTKMNRLTATKYLSFLLGRGEVKMKQFGKVKVFYLKGGR